MKTVPVCIIGGGPVGMSIALNLNALGVPCMVVNRDRETLWQPRGSTHNARTMEHYRRLGLARELRKLGLPPEHCTDVVYFTRLLGWELARLRMPSESEKQQALRHASPTDQIPEPLLRCNQMYVERRVYQHLQTLPGVDLRFGWECTAWSEDAQGVTVDIREVSSQRTEQVRCAYIGGCDGAQSIVRQQLRIAYSGDATNTDQAYMSRAMVSTHLRSEEYFTCSPHKLGWQNWTLNPSFRANMVNLDGRSELILLSQIPSIDHPPDEAIISQRFIAAVGRPVEFSILGHWKWTPGRALVADSYGRGRAVMAGDSVHLFTPTGGFGMNTGMDDAANLGWKLAALVQGWGGPKLLGSYETERRPIGLRNTSMAKLFSVHVGALLLGPEIEEDSPRGATARAQVAPHLQAFAEEFASIGIQLGARYDGSPLIVADGTVPPPDDPFVYSPSACPGGRAPHLWMADGTSLFDHFGPGFTLLMLPGADGAEGKLLQAAAAKRGVPMKILSVDIDGARELYAANMALIRPDQHVAWRGDRLPDDADGLIAAVSGH